MWMPRKTDGKKLERSGGTGGKAIDTRQYWYLAFRNFQASEPHERKPAILSPHWHRDAHRWAVAKNFNDPMGPPQNLPLNGRNSIKTVKGHKTWHLLMAPPSHEKRQKGDALQGRHFPPGHLFPLLRGIICVPRPRHFASSLCPANSHHKHPSQDVG